MFRGDVTAGQLDLNNKHHTVPHSLQTSLLTEEDDNHFLLERSFQPTEGDDTSRSVKQSRRNVHTQDKGCEMEGWEDKETGEKAGWGFESRRN